MSCLLALGTHVCLDVWHLSLHVTSKINVVGVYCNSNPDCVLQLNVFSILSYFDFSIPVVPPPSRTWRFIRRGLFYTVVLYSTYRIGRWVVPSVAVDYVSTQFARLPLPFRWHVKLTLVSPMPLVMIVHYSCQVLFLGLLYLWLSPTCLVKAQTAVSVSLRPIMLPVLQVDKLPVPILCFFLCCGIACNILFSSQSP